MPDMDVRMWKDIDKHVQALCERVGLVADYCTRVDVEIGRATFHLYRGKDGRCAGPKFVDEDGEPVREVVVFEFAEVST